MVYAAVFRKIPINNMRIENVGLAGLAGFNHRARV